MAGAELVLNGAVKPGLGRALARSDVAYIDVQNAAHGCFAARVRRW
ncbi:DUF1203 domain-containing protein [Maricaulis alexandrii]